VREGKAFCGRVVAVETGEDPRGGALIHVQLPHSFGQFGDDLDGRGSGADDGDAFAGQVEVVVPAGGVEDLALELLETRSTTRKSLYPSFWRASAVPSPENPAPMISTPTWWEAVLPACVAEAARRAGDGDAM
jgi:hypothetical protein